MTANQPPLAKVTLVKKAYHQWAQTSRSNFPEADLSVYCLHTAVVHLTELSKKKLFVSVMSDLPSEWTSEFERLAYKLSLFVASEVKGKTTWTLSYVANHNGAALSSTTDLEPKIVAQSG